MFFADFFNKVYLFTIVSNYQRCTPSVSHLNLGEYSLIASEVYTTTCVIVMKLMATCVKVTNGWKFWCPKRYLTQMIEFMVKLEYKTCAFILYLNFNQLWYQLTQLRNKLHKHLELINNQQLRVKCKHRHYDYKNINNCIQFNDINSSKSNINHSKSKVVHFRPVRVKQSEYILKCQTLTLIQYRSINILVCFQMHT